MGPDIVQHPVLAKISSRHETPTPLTANDLELEMQRRWASCGRRGSTATTRNAVAQIRTRGRATDAA